MGANANRNTRRPSNRRSPTVVVVVAVLAVLTGACGGENETASGTAPDTQPPPTSVETADDETPMDDMSSEDMDMSEGMDMSGSYGEPVDPSEADRIVEVNVDNDLAFEPADFDAAVGEVITFQITNIGDVEHEFVLGDESAQEQMAKMMESGDDHAHSGEMSNAVTIHPGESAELTWRFTSQGTVLIGCHVSGHWEAGMRGAVAVS